MRWLRRLGFVLAAIALLLFAIYVTLLRFSGPSEPPALRGSIERHTLRVGGRDRSFLSYVPPGLPPGAPLVIAFHGSLETGAAFRRHTGYRFDQLADVHNFALAYPDGFERHWNTCKRLPVYSARALHIDDVGFTRALIEHFHRTAGIDPGRVFATGHSNGGSMVLRLALEMPDQIRGVAVISASLPLPAFSDCQPAERASPVLFMNGTADPLNPYEGGRATTFGFGNRGSVYSTVNAAEYFARRAGADATPQVERLAADDGALWVERTTWGQAGRTEVVVDTVHGGGHVVPQPASRYPRLFGPTDRAFDGPAEIWRFFAQQLAHDAR